MDYRIATFGLFFLINSVFAQIRIEHQVWMDKNLNVDRFQNGEQIQEARSIEDWLKACKKGTPAWCFYDNDPENGKLYGRMYNLHAIKSSKKLCPKGWRMPDDKDWDFVREYYYKGGKVWFGAEPGGKRYDYSSDFTSKGEDITYWSKGSTIPLLGDWRVRAFDVLNDSSQRIGKRSYDGDFELGLYVRCIKD